MASPSQIDRILARLGDVPGAAPRVHAGIAFDPANGLGGIPDAANADYRGYTAYMRPRQFLQVNPPRDLEQLPIDHIRKAIEAGEPIGTPILYVDRMNDGWQVRGHEGRGRMHALEQIAPDAFFPVAVHPYGGTRARDLLPEQSLEWLRADRRGGELPARPALSILNNRPLIQPSDAEFFGKYGTHPALEGLLEELGQ